MRLGKVGEDVKLLLDPDKLLNEADIAIINQAEALKGDQVTDPRAKKESEDSKGETVVEEEE